MLSSVSLCLVVLVRWWLFWRSQRSASLQPSIQSELLHWLPTPQSDKKSLQAVKQIPPRWMIISNAVHDWNQRLKQPCKQRLIKKKVAAQQQRCFIVVTQFRNISPPWLGVSALDQVLPHFLATASRTQTFHNDGAWLIFWPSFPAVAGDSDSLSLT